MKLKRWQLEEAEKIVRWGGVQLRSDSDYPSHLSFDILDSKNNLCVCYRAINKKNGKYEWFCESKKNNGYTCIWQGWTETPQCEHTLAASLFLDKLKERL